MSDHGEHAQPLADLPQPPNAAGEGGLQGALVVGDLTVAQPLLEATVVAAPAPAEAGPTGEGDGEDGADGGAAPPEGSSRDVRQLAAGSTPTSRSEGGSIAQIRCNRTTGLPDPDPAST